MPTASWGSSAATSSPPTSRIALIWRGATYPATPVIAKFLGTSGLALIHVKPYEIRRALEEHTDARVNVPRFEDSDKAVMRQDEFSKPGMPRCGRRGIGHVARK